MDYEQGIPDESAEMTPLQKAHVAMKQKREAGELERLDPIQKAQKNPKSLRAAINGKCWDCSGAQRQEIKLCQVEACTLWPVRPYQDKTA